VNELFTHGLGSAGGHQVPQVGSEGRNGALNGAFFCAWDISAFTEREEYDESADGFLSALRETPPAPDQERVLYPGLRGAELTAERLKRGIPVCPPAPSLPASASLLSGAGCWLA